MPSGVSTLIDQIGHVRAVTLGRIVVDQEVERTVGVVLRTDQRQLRAVDGGLHVGDGVAVQPRSEPACRSWRS